MSRNSRTLFFFVLFISLIGCKRPDQISWNTDMKLPLITANLGVRDLIQDSNVVVNSDQSLSLRLEEELYKINPLDSLVEISVDPFIRSLTINELELQDISIQQDYTMGDILDDAGLTIISDGSNIPSSFLSGLGTISPDPIDLDVTDFFERAVLQEGFMDLRIENQLPLDIINLDFSIVNSSDQSVIFTRNISSIPAGTTYEEMDYDLAAALNGSEIEGQLQVIATNVQASVPGGVFFININYSDYIRFGVDLKGLKVEEATAIFPAQTVTDFTEEIEIDVQNGVELTSANMRSGNVRVQVRSTIPTELYLSYAIPSASKDGVSYSLNTTVPAATNGTVVIDDVFSLEGYTFDFTGISGNEVNKFYNTTRLDIEPTTTPIQLTTSDTVYVEISVDGLTPNSVEGYMGNNTYSVSETSVIDIFQNDLLTKVDFKTINLAFVVTNEFEIPAQIDINTLNVSDGSSPLAASLSDNTISLDATETTDQETVEISNGKDIFDLRPTQIDFDLDLIINPNGNTPPYSNTASRDENIVIEMNVDVPLELKSNGYTFVDSTEFDQLSYDLSGINEVELTLVGNNTFPIELTPVIYFAGSDGVVFDSLITNEVVQAAEIGTDGRVIEEMETLIAYPMSADRLNQLLNANEIYFKASLTTVPNSDHVTLYEDYYLNLSLVGDFDYTISSKL